MLNYKIELKVGDPSGDGHGITESILINSNLSLKEIKHAYYKGEEIFGFEFIKNVGNKIRRIPKVMVEKLKHLNFNLDDFDDNYYDNGEYGVGYELYFEIVLFLIKLGNSEFEYKKNRIKLLGNWRI